MLLPQVAETLLLCCFIGYKTQPSQISELYIFQDKPCVNDNIQKNLNKADFVPVDFRVLYPENQKLFLDYIKTRPKVEQNKIIIIRGE